MGSFRAAVAGHGVQVVYDATYEVTDPTLDQQLVAAKQSGADVFYIEANPKFAAISIRRVFELDWHPTFFLTSTGASVATVSQAPVAGRMLQVRIGIASGLVVIGEPIGSGDARQQTAMGRRRTLPLACRASPGRVTW